MTDKHVYIRKNGKETWCYGVIDQVCKYLEENYDPNIEQIEVV